MSASTTGGRRGGGKDTRHKHLKKLIIQINDTTRAVQLFHSGHTGVEENTEKKKKKKRKKKKKGRGQTKERVTRNSHKARLSQETDPGDG